MRATFPTMSTLAEIEEAVDVLPQAEQVALLWHIESKVNFPDQAARQAPRRS